MLLILYRNLRILNVPNLDLSNDKELEKGKFLSVVQEICAKNSEIGDDKTMVAISNYLIKMFPFLDNLEILNVLTVFMINLKYGNASVDKIARLARNLDAIDENSNLHAKEINPDCLKGNL